MSGEWVETLITHEIQRYVYIDNIARVDIIKAQLTGVATDEGKNFGWCYHYQGSGRLWKPLHVETLEEAKALALVMWRMGE